MAKPSHGLILAVGGIINSTADERYAPYMTSTAYAVANSTAFVDDWCHRPGSGDNTTLHLYTPFDGAGITAWTLDVGESVRVGQEIALGSTSAVYSDVFGFSAGTAKYCFENRATGNRLSITDMNGSNSVTAELTSFNSNYGYWELEVKKESATVIELVLRKDGIAVASLAHTITGGDTTVPVRYWYFGNTSDGNKSTFVTREFGFPIIATFTNGVTDNPAKQWPYNWAPTITTMQMPTSDIVNEWAVGTYARIDDAIGSYSDVGASSENATSGSFTAKKDLIMGFANIPSLGGATVYGVVLMAWAQDEASFSGGRIQAIGYDSTDPTDLALSDEQAQLGSTASAEHFACLLRLDTNEVAWTETTINAHDFGFRKMATAAATTVGVAACGMCVVYGGNAVPLGKALPFQRRRSMRALLNR